MDAKSKANFINSVATGSSIVCPECSAENKSDVSFCASCGAQLVKRKEAKISAPAFKPHTEDVATATTKYVEPNSVFAEGLPSWNLEPPQVMVRRH